MACKFCNFIFNGTSMVMLTACRPGLYFALLNVGTLKLSSRTTVLMSCASVYRCVSRRAALLGMLNAPTVAW